MHLVQSLREALWREIVNLEQQMIVTLSHFMLAVNTQKRKHVVGVFLHLG